jgi:hypothetical protein
MCELPRFSKNPLEQSIYTLKNEGQEGKTSLVKGGYQWERGG